jgi:hypothetical protein
MALRELRFRVPYAILEISPASSERVEQLGSKPKFWFRWPSGDRRWLFKYARSATGEHWAEKISAEVARIFDIPHADIELAEFGGKRGSASPTFVPPGIDLIHGNEILAGRILGYDAKKKFRQSDHTFRRIVAAFYDIFPEGARRSEALTTLAGYLTLDAIVCNVDRHHENWGILRSSSRANRVATQTIAPTFDHASSLGRELRDDKRTLLLKQKRIAEYVSKGLGAIYWKETDPKGENPLALCRRAANIHRSYFQYWINRIKNIAPAELEVLVSDVPDDWMSPIAKQFAKAILLYTTNELRKL